MLECRFVYNAIIFFIQRGEIPDGFAASRGRPPSGRTFYDAVGGGLVQFSPVTKRWECVICGYIHEGEEPPEICPVCDAPKEFFRLLEN